jgi:hypothetical protein
MGFDIKNILKKKDKIKKEKDIDLEASPKKKSSFGFKSISGIIIIFIILLFVWGIFISRTGDLIKVNPQKIGGATFVDTQIIQIEKLLNETGGFLPNDIIVGKFYDNKRNFQLGVLEVVRYSLKGLRDSLSRQRSTDKLFPELNKAFADISANEESLINPIPETAYRNSIKDLKKYVMHLETGRASFYPRSDNLAYLIRDYASLLGGITSQLDNAIDRHEYVNDMKSDKEEQVTRVEKVGFFQQDDLFYYALGVAYAMHADFQAIRIDFNDKLKEKEATVIIDQIIKILESSYFKPWLWVMNSSKGSVFANHLSNMLASLSMVRQKIDSLKIIVENN